MATLSDETFVVYGDYNIKATRPGRGGREPEPIIIHYESVDPIHNHPDGSGYFILEATDDDFSGFTSVVGSLSEIVGGALNLLAFVAVAGVLKRVRSRWAAA
jgi:hypothetical protein